MSSNREPHFIASEVFLDGIKRPTKDRTSLSAGLPPSAPLVQCVGYRAREFMGTLLEFTDDLGTPQIVRYEKGQKFDLHHDWYDSPQMLKDGTRRWFNRLGSFFVYLEANDVEEGETWFPYLKYKYDGLGVRDGRGEKWISGGEDGGVKFVPR